MRPIEEGAGDASESSAPGTPAQSRGVTPLPAFAPGAGAQTPVLEDWEDDNLEVDHDELMGFAEHLGFQLPDEQDLMWICKMALNAPVPAGWTPHNDGEGNTYYYHAETGASSWDHPSDPYFRTLLRRCRNLKVSALRGHQGSQAAMKANEELNGQLDKLRHKYTELKDAASKVSAENDELSRHAATLEAELTAQREEHEAEVSALKALHVDLRGQLAGLEALQAQNAELQVASASRRCSRARSLSLTTPPLLSLPPSLPLPHPHPVGYVSASSSPPPSSSSCCSFSSTP